MTKKRLKNDNEGQELINQIFQNSKEDFDKSMSDYFLHDLKKIMEKSKAPLVVLIDSYEMLLESGKNNTEDVEMFLDTLIEDIPHVLWIISGRKKIVDETRKKTLSSINVREHAVGLFTEQQMKEYLAKAEIEESLWPRFIRCVYGILFPHPQEVLNEQSIFPFHTALQER